MSSPIYVRINDTLEGAYERTALQSGPIISQRLWGTQCETTENVRDASRMYTTEAELALGPLAEKLKKEHFPLVVAFIDHQDLSKILISHGFETPEDLAKRLETL